MPLMIRDSLVNPPTWFASFRALTLYCSIFMKVDVLLESDDADPYYRFLKARGGMDFIEDIVSIGSEDGLRIDVEPNFPRTIITDRIAPENVHRLIAQIRRTKGL